MRHDRFNPDYPPRNRGSFDQRPWSQGNTWDQNWSPAWQDNRQQYNEQAQRRAWEEEARHNQQPGPQHPYYNPGAYNPSDQAAPQGYGYTDRPRSERPPYPTTSYNERAPSDSHAWPYPQDGSNAWSIAHRSTTYPGYSEPASGREGYARPAYATYADINRPGYAPDAFVNERAAPRRSDLRPSHAGRGPKGYTRSDDRLREDVSDRLMHDHDLDASEIEVAVENAEVTLTGSVDSRQDKFLAEQIVDSVLGVRDVNNRLRVARSSSSSSPSETNRDNDNETSAAERRTTPAASSRSTPANGSSQTQPSGARRSENVTTR